MVPRVGRSSFRFSRAGSKVFAPPPLCRQCLLRTLATQSTTPAQDATSKARRAEILDSWQTYRGIKNPPAGENGSSMLGFLGKRRNVSKHLSFADLTTPSGRVVQICSRNEDNAGVHSKFRQIAAHSPVVVQIQATEDTSNGDATGKLTVELRDIRPLNTVPKDLIVTPEVQFPPHKRHLQIRFHPELHARLKFRSWLKTKLSQALVAKDFVDIETPSLFKSTPEGAREFLVPTRQRGTAYALSQSPQQYKQALMASGIMRYMQWARCYRDEDLRTDRQPEFTQLDLEWSFADASTVQRDIDEMMLQVLSDLRPSESYQDVRGEIIPVISEGLSSASRLAGPEAHEFTTITFGESIAAYGSDKPDLRIPSRIHAMQDIEPFRNFVSMITHLEDPLVEFFGFSLSGSSPSHSRKFVTQFMDGLDPALGENPDGKPQILIYDSSKPMSGFSSLGFEYESVLELASKGLELKDGDLLVFQARPRPSGQYCLGSTKLGDLRTSLWKALLEEGLMSKPRLGDPGSLQFVWVTEFPMFKPVEADEPGQGGAAGIAASHHPFTAPFSEEDLELLFTDPLQARSAAYDLVLNGVEVGGGSERNHIASVQDFILRDVLKMADERIGDFSHLFDILRSGCPPHAGFALGFDRLVAILSDTSTVRDVIAFPKTMKGEDVFVRSPSQLSNEQLAPYGLQLANSKA